MAFQPYTALHLSVVLPILSGMSSVAAACIAVLSWRAIRMSARAAASSAETAAYNARHAELVRLQQRFEDGQYFMKFWQLELATAERALNGEERITGLLGGPLSFQEITYRLLPFSMLDPADGTCIRPRLELLAALGEDVEECFTALFEERVRAYEARDIVRDCFGPPYSSESADLLGVYSLVRALSAWVDAGAAEEREDLVAELGDAFRRELVLTLVRHRSFVARLYRGTPSEESFEYFREHYGLRDDEYARLVDDLALDADAKGLLADEHRVSIARLEMWLSETPSAAPMRTRPFPRPDWAPAVQGPAPARAALPAEGEPALL